MNTNIAALPVTLAAPAINDTEKPVPAIPEPAILTVQVANPIPAISAGADGKIIPDTVSPERTATLENEAATAASPKDPSAKPPVSQHDLILDVPLKVIGHDGVIVDLPVHLTFPGILSPAFATMAFNQFETILEQLLVMPAKVALNAYIETVIAARKAGVTPVKKSSSSAENNEDFMLPEEVLNAAQKTRAVIS